MKNVRFEEISEWDLSANPRPWTLHLRKNDQGQVTAMEVTDALGGTVEHRLSSGFHPTDFARHVANAVLYVAAVNGASNNPPDAREAEEARARGAAGAAVTDPMKGPQTCKMPIH